MGNFGQLWVPPIVNLIKITQGDDLDVFRKTEDWQLGPGTQQGDILYAFASHFEFESVVGLILYCKFLCGFQWLSYFDSISIECIISISLFSTFRTATQFSKEGLPEGISQRGFCHIPFIVIFVKEL